MSEPREFWIDDRYDTGPGIAWKANYDASPPLINVIEKSAYEKLQKENQELKDKLEVAKKLAELVLKWNVVTKEIMTEEDEQLAIRTFDKMMVNAHKFEALKKIEGEK